MITSADFGDLVIERWARHPFKLPAAAGVLLALGYFTIGLVVPNLIALVPLLIWIDANLDRPWSAWRISARSA